MNNKLISTLLASTLIFVTGTVSAGSEGKSYIGVQYGIGNYSEKNISKDFKPTALIGRFGYFFQPNYSIEGRFGTGIKGDTQFLPEFGLGGLKAKFELDSILGVYGTGHIILSDSASLYGVLGVSRVVAKASVPGFPAADSTDEKTSISYGIGADFNISKTSSLNFEYMRYIDKTDFDLGIIGAGVSFGF